MSQAVAPEPRVLPAREIRTASLALAGVAAVTVQLWVFNLPWGALVFAVVMAGVVVDIWHAEGMDSRRQSAAAILFVTVILTVGSIGAIFGWLPQPFAWLALAAVGVAWVEYLIARASSTRPER